MEIHIEEINGKSLPFLACEICGSKIIHKQKNGMFFWDDKRGNIGLYGSEV